MSSNANAVSAGARPVLKNLGRARVPKAGLIAVTGGTAAALLVKFTVCDRHKNQVTEFYK